MTNVRLYKMKIINSDVCSFCSKFPETIKHLFFDCEFIKPIWTEFEAWWKGLSNEDVNLSYKSILFGYNPGQPDLLLNLCILLTKKIIFKSRFKKQIPNFISLVHQVKYNHQLEKKIASNLNTMYKFTTKWRFMV